MNSDGIRAEKVSDFKAEAEADLIEMELQIAELYEEVRGQKPLRKRQALLSRVAAMHAQLAFSFDGP